MNKIDELRHRAAELPHLVQLGNAAKLMLWAADQLERLGYQEPAIEDVVVLGGEE